MEELEIGQPQVSRHLRILNEAGLVRVSKKAQLFIVLSPKRFKNLMFGLIRLVMGRKAGSIGVLPKRFGKKGVTTVGILYDKDGQS